MEVSPFSAPQASCLNGKVARQAGRRRLQLEDAYCFVIPVFTVWFASLKQRPILQQGIIARHCLQVYRHAVYTKTSTIAARVRIAVFYHYEVPIIILHFDHIGCGTMRHDEPIKNKMLSCCARCKMCYFKCINSNITKLLRSIFILYLNKKFLKA